MILLMKLSAVFLGFTRTHRQRTHLWAVHGLKQIPTRYTFYNGSSWHRIETSIRKTGFLVAELVQLTSSKYLYWYSMVRISDTEFWVLNIRDDRIEHWENGSETTADRNSTLE